MVIHRIVYSAPIKTITTLILKVRFKRKHLDLAALKTVT